MRSGASHTISSREVHRCALSWLNESMRMKDHGWLCTSDVVWGIVLRAAARTCSLIAACRDLANGPSDQAVFDALRDGLPKTLRVLEKRLNGALLDHLPRRLQRRLWTIAIDWHLVPYYGEPQKSRNQIFYGKPRQGTKKFHAYASACIVSHGVRYTLAVTWVRRHETTVVVLRRLLEQIRGKGLKIKRLLLDRAFFSATVTHFLQAEQVPFLMPVMFRGRTIKNKKKKRNPTGLHWIKRQKVGRYPHTLSNKTQSASLSIYVAYRTHKNRKDRKRKQQKLLFGAWRVSGSPREIRDLYRTRFGIETSYRQWRQARIFTCTRDPHLRLLFVVIGLLLRNVWLWLHETLFADRSGPTINLRLGKLRFRHMLDWIASEVAAQLHDATTPYVAIHNERTWHY
jgi:Transposase DDE domain